VPALAGGTRREPLAREPANARELTRRDRHERVKPRARGLDLDEHDLPRVADDEVELPAATVVVAREQPVPEALVVLERELLPLAPEQLPSIWGHRATVELRRDSTVSVRDNRGAATQRGDQMRGVLVRGHSFVIDRGAAVHANIELDLRAGLPGLAVIGLGAAPARDLRERVQAAVLNSGFAFPRRRVTVNVAPPVPRGGAPLDLAVACCVLAAEGELDPARIARVGLCAELGLGGLLRGTSAGMMVADAAAAAELRALVVAAEDREQAVLAAALPVAAGSTLGEVVSLLQRRPRASPVTAGAPLRHPRRPARASRRPG
jgi:hypothetical protein